MEKDMKEMYEKMNRLEVKAKKGEDEKKRRDKEREMMWKALVGIKQILHEKDEEIEIMKKKISDLEAEENKELEELWNELKVWNNEWYEKLRRNEEKEEKEKVRNFNEKRDEEKKEINRRYTKESIRIILSIIRKYEDSLGMMKAEARDSVAEISEKVDQIKNNDKAEEGESGKKEEEKSEKRGQSKKSRLAVTWPENRVREKK